MTAVSLISTAVACLSGARVPGTKFPIPAFLRLQRRTDPQRPHTVMSDRQRSKRTDASVGRW